MAVLKRIEKRDEVRNSQLKQRFSALPRLNSFGSRSAFNKNSSSLHEPATLVVYPASSNGIGTTLHTLSSLRCWNYPEVWQDCGGKTALLVCQMR
jgi:hypothetical protein